MAPGPMCSRRHQPPGHAEMARGLFQGSCRGNAPQLLDDPWKFCQAYDYEVGIAMEDGL